MTIRELKEILEDVNDDAEVLFYENSKGEDIIFLDSDNDGDTLTIYLEEK